MCNFPLKILLGLWHFLLHFEIYFFILVDISTLFNSSIHPSSHGLGLDLDLFCPLFFILCGGLFWFPLVWLGLLWVGLVSCFGFFWLIQDQTKIYLISKATLNGIFFSPLIDLIRQNIWINIKVVRDLKKWVLLEDMFCHFVRIFFVPFQSCH